MATTKSMRIAGWTLSGLVTAFLLFDVAIHVTKESHAVATMVELGWPTGLLVALGVLELAFLILYWVPQTSALGAILLTAYLGGAVATNLRVEKPLFGYVLFPVYTGLFVWGGLWLRSQRLRGLIPLARREPEA